MSGSFQRQLSEDSDDSSQESEHSQPTQFRNILKELPKGIHHKAKDILHMMSVSKDIIYWDKNGKLSYHNRTIPGSNLAELLEYVLSPEEEDIDEPVGLPSFLKGLIELRIDKAHIKNHDILRKMISMRKKINQTGGGDESEDEEQEDEEDRNESETTSDESDDDSESCENCGSYDTQQSTVKRCPECHWVDVHDHDDALVECNGCGSRRPSNEFSKTHSVLHCNQCGMADITEHDEENPSEISDDDDESIEMESGDDDRY